MLKNECSPAVPFLPVLNSTLSAGMFSTPTNQASTTICNSLFNSRQNKRLTATLFSSPDFLSPWLPVSTGDIKKTAQTRFVNASPKSYRLMPSSVESSESDRTSFVERSSHKFVLPVSYFLEVAKLWALSNRSELECQFTFAKNNSDLAPTSSQNVDVEGQSGESRPICHSRQVTSANTCPWSDVASCSFAAKAASPGMSSAEQDLLLSINRFLETCRQKDRLCYAGVTDLSESTNNMGSETRRYLSQVISLMSKKFAFKLVKQQNGLTKALEHEESRKRTVCDKLKNCRVAKEPDSPQVNVFTMSSSPDQSESESDQLLIIHIPNAPKNNQSDQEKNDQDTDGPSSKRTRRLSTNCDQMEVESSILQDKPEPATIVAPSPCFNCFYCSQSFDDLASCAKHMLSHLTSSIQA